MGVGSRELGIVGAGLAKDLQLKQSPLKTCPYQNRGKVAEEARSRGATTKKPSTVNSSQIIHINILISNCRSRVDSFPT
ncbi:MAG: hypothetical protein CLLPBCKN_001097 [Chroococcidiopsis cubana SAG 39.79]|nr:hypothetical protein [Chroococcidiopsis cubana SAG 39.79]